VRTMRDARQPPHDGPACQRAAGRLLDPPACVVALAQALAADLSIHGWPGWSIQGGYLWPPGARRSRDAYSVRDVDWITSARWIIEGYERIDRDRARRNKALAGESEQALDCMRVLRSGLNQACAAYDGLRGVIGGAPRVFEDVRRGWWAGR